jgi:N6-L-threonylcarbamoyladenine synthase
MTHLRPFVLGIETSCDETAVAIVAADGHLFAHHVLSQIDEHAAFGGVVPEIAARSHITHLDKLIQSALDDAEMDVRDLDAIAATMGPGLIGGLMVGVITAKAIAKAANIPFIAVNHLEGHALTVRLSHNVPFPFLLLLVSGGHCQLLEVAGVGDYTRLGSTIDDAVGEAFDKTAKLLGLPYPGGPAVEQAALKGDALRFKLPRPLLQNDTCDFSFSGLKTAVRRVAEKCVAERGGLYRDDVNDICAAFQLAIGDCLVNRVGKAMKKFDNKHPDASSPTLVVAGGVAANIALKSRLNEVAHEGGYTMIAPALDLCTDNGAMIAWAGLERLRAGALDDSDMIPRPRWPLDETAKPLVGSGRKGSKV